jgi:transposase
MEGTIDKRRRHSPELKARVLAACARPGASVARIALEHGLNANLVHKWRRRAALGQQVTKDARPVAEFISLPVLPGSSAMPTSDIRISIRRGGTTLDIQWPVAGAQTCALWLRELLR